MFAPTSPGGSSAMATTSSRPVKSVMTRQVPYCRLDDDTNAVGGIRDHLVTTVEAMERALAVDPRL